MLARAACLLPRALRQAHAQQAAAVLQARAYADQAIAHDPKLFKKFIGIEDNLGAGDDARGKLTGLLNELLEGIKALPADADYRRAVEATTQYRLKVLAANDSDQAAEEVLDSHLEEVILETKEELALLPLMQDWKPWDVPADYQVPVYDYISADEVLGTKA